MAGRLTSPSALFDAAAHPGREAEVLAEGLEIVARPGMAAPRALGREAFIVRRALGEGRLAVVSAVERLVEGRSALAAEGVACEGYADGVFVEVDGGPGGRRSALRIADAEGFMRDDTVVLRPVGARRRQRPEPAPEPVPEPEPEPASEDDPTPLALLLAAVYARRAQGKRPLGEPYLRSLLEPASGTAPATLNAELQRAVADFERRRAALPAGADRAAAEKTLLDELAASLLKAAELKFILDPARSTLELLEPAERDRYLGFKWEYQDFPGGEEGPNEARARQMFDALTMLRPERRANSGPDAAVTKGEFDQAMRARLTAALVEVPGERGLKLHRDASASYVELRTAAAADGVTISINNSYRTPETAQKNAAKAGNATAVAKFSSHSLGLAVDLNVSQGTLTFREVKTRPFSNLVGMYKSPVHKWMFLRGEAFGWYPYRPEPWHWEYNPKGLRERLREPAPAAATSPAAAPATAPATTPSPAATPAPSTPAAGPAGPRPMEAVDDPLTPLRAALTISAGVGKSSANKAADVSAVQDRLVELRALESADATAERPTGTAAVAETALVKTIAAIKRFQTAMGDTASGTVVRGGGTHTNLDRAIPQPTAAELTAVTTQRGTITEVVSRGLTITGPVGDTATGNAPADVRAVQARLVAIGRLAAAHGEGPAAAATTAVPKASLPKTIAAIKSFQDNEVTFWKDKGTVAGAITTKVVASGDATAKLLDAIAVYTETVGGLTVTFRDHVKSGYTVATEGVMSTGTSKPGALAMADYEAQGLTRNQAAALKEVSKHEGNFDAVNTYDAAAVSVGFIQFAGSRGLPPYIALLKARKPAKFRDLMQKYGIEAEFKLSGNTIEAARLGLLDPAGTRVLRGEAAEKAVRADKKLTAAMALAGRDRDVQLVQIEAAIRGYVRPSLASTVSWAAGRSAKLSELLRSQKGMACLFDRAIQEGLGGASSRFERCLQKMARPAATTAPPPPAPTLAEMQAREGDLLAEIERDLQAAADTAAALKRAAAKVDALRKATAKSGATVAAVLALSERADARRAITEARAALAGVVYVAPPKGSTTDARLAAMATALVDEDTRLAYATPPGTITALATSIKESAKALEATLKPVNNGAAFLKRIQDLRGSTLDSGLTEGD